MNNQKRDTAISRVNVVLGQLATIDTRVKALDKIINAVRRGREKGTDIDIPDYGKTTVDTEPLLLLLINQSKELKEQQEFFSKNIIMSAELFNSVFTIPIWSEPPSESPDKPDKSPDRPDVSPDQADKGE